MCINQHSASRSEFFVTHDRPSFLIALVLRRAILLLFSPARTLETDLIRFAILPPVAQVLLETLADRHPSIERKGKAFNAGIVGNALARTLHRERL